MVHMQNPQNVTQAIHAAHNLTIELAPASWRLLNGARQDENPAPLVNVDRRGITCSPAFTRARRIPHDGKLNPPDVARVVVGWAPESANWHLGFLLAAQPDSGYKARWCGLASWPSGVPGDSMTDAKRAGQALARLIDRPLHLIPPPQLVAPQPVAPQPVAPQPVSQTVSQAAARTAPAPADTQPLDVTAPMQPIPVVMAPEPSLQMPPFQFEDVVMRNSSRGYVWQYRGRWVVGTALRAVGLVTLAALFLILSVGTQTSDLAAVQPGWLPLLGLVVAVMLVFSSLHTFWRLLTVSDVVLETTAGEVRRRSRFWGHTRWRVPFGAVSYVLVSQAPARPQGRKRPGEPMRIAQDVWLHIYDGRRFWPVVALERVEGESANWETVRTRQKKQGRRPLSLADYDSPVHHAARVMANAIGTDVWLDIR